MQHVPLCKHRLFGHKFSIRRFFVGVLLGVVSLFHCCPGLLRTLGFHWALRKATASPWVSDDGFLLHNVGKASTRKSRGGTPRRLGKKKRDDIGKSPQVYDARLGQVDSTSLTGILPGLQSVRQYSHSEGAGIGPMFIDAIRHPDGRKIYIIFNMMGCVSLNETRRLYGQGASDSCKRLWIANWTCHWSVRKPLLGVINFVEMDGREGRGAVLVLECPVVPRKPLTVLTLEARVDQHRLHRLENIHVSSGSYFDRKLNIAACTQIVRRSDVVAYLIPWLNYHLELGVERFLIYVEDRDLSWAQKLLHQYLKDGTVKLLKFWYPDLSRKHKFLTQWAGEHHCLYWARGRVKWMAHMDVDEFFMMMGNENLSVFLDGHTRENTSAVQARGAYWQFNTTAERDESLCNGSFPCWATCNHGLWDVNKRSKMILNPDNLMYYTPHKVIKSVPGTYQVNATGIQLVHIKFRKEIPSCSTIDWSFHNSKVCRQFITGRFAPSGAGSCHSSGVAK